MGSNRNLKARCAGALLASLVALAGAPLQAQDAAPSDAEMATAAPSKEHKDSGGDAAQSDGHSKEVYGKHVERVKNIRSIFAKLKTQVESMEQVQQAPQLSQLPPDLPPEALETSDDPAPSPEESSVLDEAPAKPKADKKDNKDKKDKKGKKPKATAAEPEPEVAQGGADDEREPMQAGGKGMSTYTVKAGDTLGKIAAKTLGSSKKAPQIAKANGMGVSEALKVGRSLIIPGGGMTGDSAVGDVAVAGKAPKTKKEKKERKPKNPASEPVLDYSNYDFKMYVVKPGDSLSKIAKAFYESGNGAELIRKYNKLGGSAGKEAPLKSGEKILIPLPKQKASEDRYEKAKKGIF